VHGFGNMLLGYGVSVLPQNKYTNYYRIAMGNRRGSEWAVSNEYCEYRNRFIHSQRCTLHSNTFTALKRWEITGRAVQTNRSLDMSLKCLIYSSIF